MKKRALYSGLGLAAVVALVIVLAELASFIPNLRLDFTEDRLYTLSDGTRNMLKGLGKPVKVELFWSRSLAEGVPQIANYAQRVEALLDEYARLSGGKLTVSVVDPEPFSGDEDRAAELGLLTIPLVPGGPEIHFGLAVTGESGKTEIIDFFRPEREEMLEYDLSQLVWKASRTTVPKVGLVSGLDVQGGFDFMSRRPTPPWAAVAQLEQLYAVEALPPDFDAVPEDVGVLLVVHPAGLGEKSLRAIDRYALAGRALMVFVDPYAERAGGGLMGGADPTSDLAPLLAAWGVSYDPLMALVDAQLAVPVASEEYGRPVPHVGIQQFGPGELPTRDIITDRFERLIMASAGVLKPREGATSTFVPLVQSSDQAMLVRAGLFDNLADHTKLYEGFQPTGERYTVAARITGTIASAYPPVAGEATAAAPAVAAKPANIVLVADTDVLSDRLWVQVQDFMGQQVAQPFADNGGLLSNGIDSLMGSADLLSIRGRGRYERPFEVVDRIERQAQLDLQAKAAELEQRLAETETRLQELESRKAQDAQAFELDEAQVGELEKFAAEKLRIRKELREVQHQLGSDIEQLGALVKLVNILVAPLLLVLLVWGVRRLLARR